MTDHFITTPTRPVTIASDNASVYSSMEFRHNAKQWVDRDAELFQIPHYNPELKRIKRFSK
ncbi:hypothetical protein [Neorhodopirellula lusitana]|uniref:hypothetical protein n=1 Tax=Neorhodopirellula lusitana TaxID=445327 RepID=UPI0024B7277A|nr:hypothetical protein [Neorhodopirellula lusitana]